MQRLKRSLKPKEPDSKIINFSNIDIQLVRKNIKNVNFSVSTFNARVRVSVPSNLSEDELLLILESRLDWMRNKIQAVKNLPALIDKKYISGENHKFLGKSYKLEVVEHTGKPKIILQSPETLKMFVRPNTSFTNKEKLLNDYYRAELKKRIPGLITKWQLIIGKEVSEWGVKRMKTRWGTCNINKKRIWLNLELAKQPEACLEYVVVHEMTHLLERNHNSRFRNLLDGFLPNWQEIEDILNLKRMKRRMT